MIVDDQSTVYHVMSRTALDGFPLGDIEKDFMLDLIQCYAALYLVEILGFCLMGNHFHILVRVIPDYKFSDEDILKRYVDFYGDGRIFTDGLIPSLRLKLSSLSEFMGKAIGSDLHISQKDIFLYSFQKFTELFVLFRFQAYPVARLGDT
jgi:hypothetical protein